MTAQNAVRQAFRYLSISISKVAEMLEKCLKRLKN